MAEQIDTFSYVNGFFAAAYFVVCLLCGLQSCFGIFHRKQPSNTILSEYFGIILLLLSCGAICYILSESNNSNQTISLIGCTIDGFALVGMAAIGHVLCTNERPSLYVLSIMVAASVVYTSIYLIFPVTRHFLPDIAIVVFILLYIHYGMVTIKQDRSLENIYSSPDLHSRKWIGGITVFFIVWWILRSVFIHTSLIAWYNVVSYCYMTGFILYTFTKVSNYGEPVSIEVQKDVEQVVECCVEENPPVDSGSLKLALLALMKDERVYLQSDLTVDDVVKMLGTNTKYFSSLLRNDLHTTFCAFINKYRVEYAKELLCSSEEKVERIGMLCGFHSRQAFYNGFSRITGMTPTEWRNTNPC